MKRPGDGQGFQAVLRPLASTPKVAEQSLLLEPECQRRIKTIRDELVGSTIGDEERLDGDEGPTLRPRAVEVVVHIRVEDAWEDVCDGTESIGLYGSGRRGDRGGFHDA